MTRLLSSFVLFAMLGTVPQAQAQTLALEFLPPAIEPSDICAPFGAGHGDDDPTIEGTNDELTDQERIRYLRRDIHNYSNENASEFFDFINALIRRRGEIDESFPEVDQILAQIDLWLQAGRIETLGGSGLVQGLRDNMEALTNNQRVTLARFYTDGIGVTPDRAFAQELIREAAYGGNANALLEIASLAQKGEMIEGWDAPLDLTVTMAFGGILGAMDRGVCARAEKIAQAYVKGDVVAQNASLALAWFRFAADMGRGESAWRVVEFHLNADAAHKDNLELLHYLNEAVRLGVSLTQGEQETLTSSGAITAEELAALLGFNQSQDPRRAQKSITPLLQLVVNIDGMEADNSGKHLLYLREIALMPEAPGRVFERLANEVLIKEGRWAGEAEAMEILEEAVARGDGQGQRRLAQMSVRYRDDPAMIARAENLYMEVMSRHGMAVVMNDLDRLYRCQVNDAPRLQQADTWAANYAATDHRIVTVSALDLVALAPDRSPEAIAKIQSLALDRRVQMVASQAQRVQSNPLASDAALRFWAAQVNRSDQVLEAFAELEFALASTPAQRELAIEFFRRVYINNGVTTALDLAIALVEFNGRDPEVAEEIVTLLTMAGNRGEGGAIRLLSRLQAETRSEADVYAEFADKIEKRGDFLALMFAIPHLKTEQIDDYIDRAVSLMSCGTKDAAELGEAYAIHGDGPMSYHWRKISLSFEGGHVLSRLRLSNRQMQLFNDGAAPNSADVALRDFEDGDNSALMRLITLTANPDLESYDVDVATGHILNAIQRSTDSELAEVVAILRSAPDRLRAQVGQSIDISSALQRAAESGSADAAFELGMVLRGRAESAQDLAVSTDWLHQAAKQGNRDAMFEYGYAVGFGLGYAADPDAALNWLEQASLAGHPLAPDLVHVMRIKTE